MALFLTPDPRSIWSIRDITRVNFIPGLEDEEKLWTFSVSSPSCKSSTVFWYSFTTPLARLSIKSCTFRRFFRLKYFQIASFNRNSWSLKKDNLHKAKNMLYSFHSSHRLCKFINQFRNHFIFKYTTSKFHFHFLRKYKICFPLAINFMQDKFNITREFQNKIFRVCLDVHTESEYITCVYGYGDIYVWEAYLNIQ